MSEAITTYRNGNERLSEAIERVLITGDLSPLTPEQRVQYYNRVCESVGLNPYTRPFDYLKLNGKLVLYARKDATEQLRKIHQVSVVRLEREHIGDCYCVTAYARDASGREDSDTGVVAVKGLTGENLANAIMKATTKAKRRTTLSICGLGMLDETEVESIPGAVKYRDGFELPEPGAETPSDYYDDSIADLAKPLTRELKSPEDLRAIFRDTAEKAIAKNVDLDNVAFDSPEGKKKWSVAQAGLSAVAKGEVDRHDLLEFLFGVKTSKGLNIADCDLIANWTKVSHDNHWSACEEAKREAAMVLEYLEKQRAAKRAEPLPFDGRDASGNDVEIVDTETGEVLS